MTLTYNKRIQFNYTHTNTFNKITSVDEQHIQSSLAVGSKQINRDHSDECFINEKLLLIFIDPQCLNTETSVRIVSCIYGIIRMSGKCYTKYY